jgi:hypothetical protein
MRLAGTCDWLIENRIYAAWRDESTAKPIIWLHAPPGTGKSMLCCRAIESIDTKAPGVAVAYHFYRFDQEYTRCQTLQILAFQLLLKLWDSRKTVSRELHEKVSRMLRCDEVEDVIRMLVKELSRVHFFLDGLDEESSDIRWNEANPVLTFLIGLCSELPSTVRLWCSSQHQKRIDDKFQSSNCEVLKVEERMKGDVAVYLSSMLPEAAREIIQDSDQQILEGLQSRASGNFLWAKFMIDDLTNANSPSHMKQLLDSDLPSNLDSYYKRIFRRFAGKDLGHLAR